MPKLPLEARILVVACSCALAWPSMSAAQLQVGAAAVEFQVPDGAPLAGYSDRRRAFPNPFAAHTTFFHPYDDLDASHPIRVKALLLRKGSDDLLFLSLDLIAVTAAIRGDLLVDLQAAGVLQSGATVLISATHTHSGPGALSDQLVWELTATDLFDAAIYQPFRAAVQQVVVDASADLGGPASLRAGKFTVAGVQRNRHGWRDPAFVDDEINALVAERGGRIAAAMLNLGVHGTVLGSESFDLSSDLPGHVEMEVETALKAVNGDALPVPVLFVNGAEGDVAPIEPAADPFGGAGIVRDAVAAALPGFRSITDDFQVQTAAIELGASMLGVGQCAEGGWDPLVPDWLGLPLPFLLGGSTTIWSIRLGDMRLLTVPGEPTTELGFELKLAGNAESGTVQTWVLGLTNDHLAYFALPHEFDHPSYATCSSLFGRDAGEEILNAHKALMGEGS